MAFKQITPDEPPFDEIEQAAFAERARVLRQVALESASRVTGSVIFETGGAPNHEEAAEYTLAMAELFARWIESGVR